MTKKEYWYGYLEAGDRSSPVLIDNSLETGNQQTQYVYNLNRNAILEYRRDIVSTKLRELTGDEKETANELKKGYEKVKKDFTPKGNGKPLEEKLAAKAISDKPKKSLVYDIPDDSDDSWSDDDGDDD